MSNEKVLEATDAVNYLLLESNHIQNVLDILNVGFENYQFDCREQAESCIHVLCKYYENVQKVFLEQALGALSGIE